MPQIVKCKSAAASSAANINQTKAFVLLIIGNLSDVIAECGALMLELLVLALGRLQGLGLQ